MTVSWISANEWANSKQREAVEAAWQADQLRLVSQALQEVGLQPLLVGGVVRDLFLGRPNKDVDLIVNCRAKKLMKMGVRLGKLTNATPVPLDKDRGTLRLCFASGEEVDLVSLQGESLWEDLERRDLRINAMAIDSDGSLADPFDGREDLRSGQLREIRAENFREDPLRVLRGVRFAAQLDFVLEPDSISSARSAVAGLESVAGERITVELKKFFSACRPHHIDLLKQLEVLVPIFHIRNYGWSLLKELSQESPPGLGLGLAALFGPCLPKSERDPLFERLKLARKIRRFLEHWWEGADRARLMPGATPEDIFDLSKVAGEAYPDLARAVVCRAFECRLSDEERARLLTEAKGQGELRWESVPWNGDEVTERLGREPGPWLGDALRKLEKSWALRQVKTLDDALLLLE